MRVVGDSFRRLVLLGATPLNAMTFILWDKFPNYQGQNNFYAYGYQFSEDVYRQLTLHEDPPIYYYTPEQPFTVPHVSRHYSTSASGWVRFHPSSASHATVSPPEDAVLAWVVTETNIFRIFGACRGAPGGGTGYRLYQKKSRNPLVPNEIGVRGSYF
jgi:hypothetical protein